MGMLSTAFPRFTQGSIIDLFAYIQPARDVGGDFYDFFHLDEKTLLIAIGDVSGKGVPAALFMVMVKTLLRAIAKQHQFPDQMMGALNPELCRDNDAMMFVTLFIATLDLDTKQLKYSYGGHNRPVYLSNYGEVSLLPGDPGIALGILDEATFSMESMQLNAGDSLLLYTDGINEAMNINYEQYGDDRLCDLLRGCQDNNAQDLVEIVTADVNVFTKGAEQSDDISLLALQLS
jgi:sigma-B regulation protein RsbU (phosphoserine phosphatase)